MIDANSSNEFGKINLIVAVYFGEPSEAKDLAERRTSFNCEQDFAFLNIIVNGFEIDSKLIAAGTGVTRRVKQKRCNINAAPLYKKKICDYFKNNNSLNLGNGHTLSSTICSSLSTW